MMRSGELDKAIVELAGSIRLAEVGVYSRFAASPAVSDHPRINISDSAMAMIRILLVISDFLLITSMCKDTIS